MSNNFKPVKIGIIGVGHLGKFHLQQLKEIESAQLQGVYDLDIPLVQAISADQKIPAFTSMDELINTCDAVSIVTPTSTHFEVASNALQNGCHVFIEKPITKTVAEARALLGMAEQHNLIIQVGHIEQFNPAFMTINNQECEPQFIECHRLAPFNPRGTDVPVVLDLMIHDIGIILSMVDSPVKDIRASGVNVVSQSADIANARIEFENGCVANLTSSRISQKKMRKLRFFQNNAYTTVDFLLGVVETYHVTDHVPSLGKDEMSFKLEGKQEKYVIYQKPDVIPQNALKLELEHFIESIQHQKTPVVDGHSATEALDLAIRIQNIIDGNEA
ncbi:MAG: Gfo/Idh/MocA family protein [Fidelibacterota bacterium]